MRSIVIFIIVIWSFSGQVSAQEIDTLSRKISSSGKSRAFPEFAGRQMSPDSVFIPSSQQNLKSGFELQKPALPNINFNLAKGWKTQMGPLLGLKNINPFTFIINPLSLYGRSVWDFYQGTYGIRMYQLNNKLLVGTAGYSDKNFNAYSQQSGFYRQTNYSSSLFVGYKFSDKFSISAGFTIQHNGDPLNRNQEIRNGGMFP